MNDILTERIGPVVIIMMAIGLNIFIWTNFEMYLWIFGLITIVVSVFSIGIAIQLWREY